MTPEVKFALIAVLGTLFGTVGGNALSNHRAAKRGEA
jgi:hypothetical protein